jgi:hypothetical protein
LAKAVLLKMDAFQGRLDTPARRCAKRRNRNRRARLSSHGIAAGAAWKLPALVVKVKQPK